MLNVIWLAMILVAVLAGGFNGRLGGMTEGAFAMAKSAVMETVLPLVGLMALWLGMMRLAERAGLVKLLARALRPVMRRLFPDVPAEHPAHGAMVLNMSANMLGLGNAATPLGLRAMTLLQQINPRPGVASNAMVTFLAMNTASIQLVPTTAISILAVYGAKNSSGIVMPALIATAIAMTCGVLVAKLLAPMFPARDDDGTGEAKPAEVAPIEEPPDAPPMTTAGRVVLALFFTAFAAIFAVMVNPWGANALPEAFGWTWRYRDYFPGLVEGQRAVRALSLLAVPFLLSFFPLYAHLRRVKVYEQFCEGAKDALATATRIIPFIVAMLVAISLLREAGVVGMVTEALRPVLTRIHFPPELLAVPFLLSFFPLYAHLRRVKVYEQFCEGAKDALATATRIIPFIVAMLVAISLLREAGVVGMLTDALRPTLDYIGFPAELLPLALMRPLSGGASQGIFVDLVKAHGADSMIANMAATIYGSTETTFYVLAVYFGSVGIRKTRHAVLVGLTADIVALFTAIFACRWLLG